MNDLQRRLSAMREDRAERVRQQAERSLYDHSFDWLRPLPVRRLLVATLATALVVVALANALDSPVFALVALLTYLCTLIALRTSIRLITELPDDLVDERLQAIRGRVYRLAMIGTGGLIAATIVLQIALELTAKSGLLPVSGMNGDQWFDLMFVLLFAALALPSAIFAWTEPEL